MQLKHKYGHIGVWGTIPLSRTQEHALVIFGMAFFAEAHSPCAGSGKAELTCLSDFQC